MASASCRAARAMPATAAPLCRPWGRPTTRAAVRRCPALRTAWAAACPSAVPATLGLVDRCLPLLWPRITSAHARQCLARQTALASMWSRAVLARPAFKAPSSHRLWLRFILAAVWLPLARPIATAPASLWPRAVHAMLGTLAL